MKWPQPHDALGVAAIYILPEHRLLTNYCSWITTKMRLTTGEVQTIRKHASRLGELTKKIMAITAYRTRDYLTDQIIDIHDVEEQGSADLHSSKENNGERKENSPRRRQDRYWKGVRESAR